MTTSNFFFKNCLTNDDCDLVLVCELQRLLLHGINEDPLPERMIK